MTAPCLRPHPARHQHRHRNVNPLRINLPMDATMATTDEIRTPPELLAAVRALARLAWVQQHGRSPGETDLTASSDPANGRTSAD